jgi:uncharacterized protein
MEQRHNVVGWFEIPVLNMERAIKFYEKIFDFKLVRHQIGNLDMAWFPWIDDAIGASGSLVLNDELHKPSNEGVLIYFTAQSGDLSVELSRVEGAGGKVHLPKTLITDDIGYMAIIEDTEGNRIALHARK